MKNTLEKILQDGLAEIQKSEDEKALLEAEVKYLGRKGLLAEQMQGIAALSLSEKQTIGPLANRVKTELTQAVAVKRRSFETAHLSTLAQKEWQDPTFPAKQPTLGRVHPVSAFIEEIRQVFTALGFEIADGPELEDDYHNFEALNIPADHPARDSQDTFFLKNFPQNLLRTQTSAMQIRWCEEHEPPIRIVAPGKCYRKDELDATHSPLFHQFEGMVIDENISLANLQGVLSEAFRALLGKDIEFRFRTSYFPFVEPGLEVDATCIFCKGKGCRICKRSGWVEIAGCGMVHPNVLKAVKLDPEKYTGFAFGAGIERMLMMRHQVPDIRYFYENDLRFLQQF